MKATAVYVRCLGNMVQGLTLKACHEKGRDLWQQALVIQRLPCTCSILCFIHAAYLWQQRWQERWKATLLAVQSILRLWHENGLCCSPVSGSWMLSR